MANKRSPTQLPNAPLVEVVFELRWSLHGSPDMPAVFRSDPAFLPLLEEFTRRIRKAGFSAVKEITKPHETGPHGVVRRFYTSDDKSFPLVQIGDGIFASNQSSDYDWASFKKQTLNAIRILLAAYPVLPKFPMIPIHLELRYVDVFTKELLGSSDLFDFLTNGTTLNIHLPDILTDVSHFTGDLDGRIVVQRKLKSMGSSIFVLDIGSGISPSKGGEIYRLESKVISRNEGAPKLKRADQFLKQADIWLERAHSITSPFFKSFVTSRVMEKFKN